MAFIDWYKKNKKYINATLIFSGALGVIVASSAAVFPPFLVGLAAFSLFGGLPFAFLTTLPLALSLPILGIFLAVFSTLACSTAFFLARQIGVIGQHILALFTKEKAVAATYSATESYGYLAEHLQKSVLDFRDAEEDELIHFIATTEEVAPPQPAVKPLLHPAKILSSEPVIAVQTSLSI